MGFQFVRLDGRTSQAERARILSDFADTSGMEGDSPGHVFFPSKLPTLLNRACTFISDFVRIGGD
jgi:hypothetical protein